MNSVPERTVDHSEMWPTTLVHWRPERPLR